MKTEKRSQQKVRMNVSHTEHSQENAKTAMEIYRMIYFLNKIEDPRLEDTFKKYKVQFGDVEPAELKGTELFKLNDNIGGQKNIN